MSDATPIIRRFKELFGQAPRVFRAPGRVNLIGEHTDYNDGFVMPAAIGLYCWVAAAPRSDRQLALHSGNMGQSASVNLDDPYLAPKNDWTDYVVGTALALQKSGYAIRGADMLIVGEVPFGSGLSSSAAIEVAVGYTLLELSGFDVDLKKLAIACRSAENEFVGARVGIMDQFVSAHGLAGHALMLDCRSLEFKQLPIPSAVSLVVCNTGVRHSIAGGEYNQRRAQCEEGVRLLSSVLPEVRALRDVSPPQLEARKDLLPELIYRRCRHIVTENERVKEAAASLNGGDLKKFGQLMADSHRSLRDDYEVSCRELDIMVEIAQRQAGLVGARMTGGGFGGCTINLVRNEAADQFRNNVARDYQQSTGIDPDIYVLEAANGVSQIAEPTTE